ncbi:MAG: bifunctional alpha/beta hydrolase/OsmC family protein [Aureliella sp.]
MPKFNFENSQGHTLSGNLEMPDGAPKAFGIFAHCFTCSKNAKAASRISRRLAERGIAVLRFDFTGLGNSDGDFANTNFSSNVNDLVDAANALEKQYRAPSLLIGHSLGGAAAYMAAGQLVSVRAVATIGSPSEPAHVSHLFGDTIATIRTDGAAEVSIGGRKLTIEKHFLDDLKTHRADKQLREMRKALLIFHSPVDEIVSIENARKLYESARHPKSFVSLDGADHLLSSPDDAEFVASTLSAWASRYLPEDLDAAPTRPELEAGEVVVLERDGGMTQDIFSDRHHWLADEPFRVGGNDSGPTPYDLLLGSLGSCISLTLRMYAERKQFPLKSVRVQLKHERIHASDCDSCESQDGMVGHITKHITVTGPLDQQQLDRLREIADRCPVHRTLVGEKMFTTELTHL